MTTRVGITGGIGSGKTLVCSILEVLGVPVYYADHKARELMNGHRDLAGKIRELLGPGSYHRGVLDRRYVANRVFGDSRLLEGLNALVHPVVREDFKAWADRHAGLPYVVEEAAILFESGAYRSMDHTLLVYADRETRIRRVMERDRVERKDVIRRMAAQMDEEEKRARADEVIVNDGKALLLPELIRWHERMINKEA